MCDITITDSDSITKIVLLSDISGGHIMKKFSALVASVALVSLLFGCSDIAEDENDGILQEESRAAQSSFVKYTQANEICTYTYQGYNGGQKGPIIVTQGTLDNGWTSTNVYLITLSGTEIIENQSTGYLTDALSGFNQKSKYYTNVVSVIERNIPKNSNLILAGHSLGGMIAQQVSADNTIKADYNVMNVVTFGSPLLSAGSREGTVRRLGDQSDLVPYMSGSLVNNTVWAIAGLNRENGGYGMNAYAAHTESYLRSDEWGAYDVTGKKHGTATLTLNLNTQRYFKSPVNVKN